MAEKARVPWRSEDDDITLKEEKATRRTVHDNCYLCIGPVVIVPDDASMKTEEAVGSRKAGGLDSPVVFLHPNPGSDKPVYRDRPFEQTPEYISAIVKQQKQVVRNKAKRNPVMFHNPNPASGEPIYQDGAFEPSPELVSVIAKQEKHPVKDKAKSSGPKNHFSPESVKRLLEVFEVNRSPDMDTRKRLSVELNETLCRITNWFVNKRSRTVDKPFPINLPENEI